MWRWYFITPDFFHKSLDMGIFPRASSPRFLLFWWSSRPEKCTSSGMSWFAVCILKCIENQIWTAKTDCKPASSTGISLHLTKMIWVTGGQPPCHTWLPWCNSHSYRVSDKNRPLPLRTDPCWWQKRNIRILHLPGRMIVHDLFPLSISGRRQIVCLFSRFCYVLKRKSFVNTFIFYTFYETLWQVFWLTDRSTFCTFPFRFVAKQWFLQISSPNTAVGPYRNLTGFPIKHLNAP